MMTPHVIDFDKAVTHCFHLRTKYICFVIAEAHNFITGKRKIYNI